MSFVVSFSCSKKSVNPTEELHGSFKTMSSSFVHEQARQGGGHGDFLVSFVQSRRKCCLARIVSDLGKGAETKNVIDLRGAMGS